MNPFEMVVAIIAITVGASVIKQILRAKVEFFMKLDQQKKELEAKLAQAHSYLEAYNSSKTRIDFSH